MLSCWRQFLRVCRVSEKTDAVAQEFFLVHAQVSGAGGKGFFIWDQERFVGALEAEKLADDVVSAQVVGASEIVDSGREG